MAKLLLAVVLLVGVAAQTSVIQSDASVAASIKVQGSSDYRSYRVTPSFDSHTISISGVDATYSSNSGSTSASVDTVYIGSEDGTRRFPHVDWSQSSFSFSTGAGFNADQTSVFTSFRPLAVIYYTDNNGNGKFDFGEGTRTDRLNTGTWTTTTTSAANSKVTLVTSQRTDQSFGFRYSAQNVPITNQGATVGADTLKLDVWITTPDNISSNTRVALLATFSALQSSATAGGSFSSQNVSTNSAARISFSRTGTTSALTWANTAAVSFGNSNGKAGVTADVLNLNGNTITVANASLTDASFGFGRFLVFSFDANAPKQIYWDPTVGAAPPSDAAALSFSLAVVLALVALLL